MKPSKYNLYIPLENQKEKYILFNTLYGSTFTINKNTKNILENNQLKLLSMDEREEFEAKKILVENNVDELKYIEYMLNQTKFSRASLNLTVLLTWACNLKCVYCYQGAGEIKKGTMTKSTANKVIDFARKRVNMYNYKGISIILFGGEPLLNIKVGEYILKELQHFCEDKNIEFISGIITNGILLNDDIIKNLIKRNCKYVQITLDGPQQIHDKRRITKGGEGTFDEIIDKLSLFKNYEDKLTPLIRINIDKSNIDNTKNLLSFLKEKGFTNYKLDFGIVRGNTKACSEYSSTCFLEEEVPDVLDKLWEEAKNKGFRLNFRPARRWLFCGLEGDYSYTIAPDGGIYKCWELMEEEHKYAQLYPLQK